MANPASGSETEDALSRLASGNSALQNLLRRLETGLEELLPNSSGRAKMRELLAALKEVGNEGRQMEALVELCEVLSMGQEDVLLGFNVDSFLEVLVDILKMEHNPEMMLLSSRAITHMLEVLPKCAPKVAASGAVQIFCQRLLNIEFIDVAEQSLMAMHKLSVEHGDVLQREGGLAACLMFVDFFDLNTQRTAAATAANICRCVPADGLEGAAPVTANVAQLLCSADQRIVESGCLALARLVEAFGESEAAVEAVLGRETIHHIVGMLSPADRQERGVVVSVGTATMMVKTLATACRASPAIAVQLLEAGGLGLVQSLLTKADKGRDGGAGLAAGRPVDQLLHSLALSNELLPPPPAPQELVELVKAACAGTEGKEDLLGKHGSAGLLEAFAAANPGLVGDFGPALLPAVVEISVSLVNEAVRIKCLAAMTKLVGVMAAGDLAAGVEASPLLGYLSGHLASGLAPLVALSLILIDMLLHKLPDLALRCAQEGVMHAVKRVSVREAVSPGAADQALTEFAQRLLSTRFGSAASAGLAQACDAALVRAQDVAARLDRGQEEALEEVCRLLTGPDALSSFQLVTSGLARSLLGWLGSGDARRVGAFVRIVGLAERRAAALDALGAAGPVGPVRALVERLKEAVSVRESLPVVLSDASGDLSAGLKLLAQPLKLRLAREAGETGLGDYSGNVVLIEPLATLRAVNDFLASKVLQPVPHPASPPTPPQAPTEATVGDGASAAGAGEEEGWGGGSLSGGEEGLGMGDEGDEAEDGPAADITRPTPARPYPSRSGGAAGLAGGGDVQLVFSVKGRAVPLKTPIIQAVGAWACGAGVPVTGKTAWEQVHTVTYRLARLQDLPVPAADGEVAGAVGDKDKGGDQGDAVLEPVGPEEELVGRLAAGLAVDEVWAAGEVREALGLLRALSLVSRDWFLLSGHAAAAEERVPLVAPGHLVIPKLASKLMRQLQDPVMVCTGSVPGWVAQLVRACPAVFPLDARQHFTATTALGVSRALHAIQRLQGRPDQAHGDVRIGRIQRDKIRVSRSRILSSAMRALELYASHRSILEVEYYGEAGTGLGPTLEFFTLVSQELQAARLRLWRDAGTEKRGARDGVSRAPGVRVALKGFHLVAVRRCTGCGRVHFGRCEEHQVLFTARGPGGGGACHACLAAGRTSAAATTCEECGSGESLGEDWWLLSDEEAAYAHSAFPPALPWIDHMVLQCPHCKSVNFPGTEQALVVNKKGQMTSLSGKVMEEANYREVTRHAAAACANSPLDKLPVRLAAADCALLARLVGSTPEAEEGSEGGGGGRWAWMDGEAGAAEGYLWSPRVPEGVVGCFGLVGRLLAKGLLDERPLDLPLSPAVYRWMVGQPLGLADLLDVDPALHASLAKLRKLGQEVGGGGECPLEALDIDFCLPGAPEVELVAGGRGRRVTRGNLESFVDAVWRFVLVAGVAPQLAALRAGFDQVWSMGELGVLTWEELEARVRGESGGAWDSESLRGAVRADHGYKETSPQLAWLLTTMAEMDTEERRLLLRFLTGCPSLPPGGLAGLQPRLTVVRKEADPPLRPDDLLPSVMTCANYLKLPEYSSPEVLRARLHTAIREGQLSFLLS